MAETVDECADSDDGSEFAWETHRRGGYAQGFLDALKEVQGLLECVGSPRGVVRLVARMRRQAARHAGDMLTPDQLKQRAAAGEW